MAGSAVGETATRDDAAARELASGRFWSGPRRELELYLHYPFCSRRCGFCYYDDIVVDGNRSRHGAISDDVLRSIQAYRNRRAFSASRVETVYLGGGTPSLMSHAELEAVRDTLAAVLDEEPHETTLEVYPSGVEEEDVRHYADLGFNRVSLGVQTLDSQVLSRAGRLPLQDLETLVGWAREYGISNVNVDLIAGLPGQDVGACCRDVAEVARIGVPHVTLYRLRPRRDRSLTRETAERVDLLWKAGVDLLIGHGYERYSVDHFTTANGPRSRQEERIWRGGDYLGVGRGATSFVRGLYFRTRGDVGSTQPPNSDPIAACVRLSRRDRMRRAILVGISNLGELDLGAFEARHNTSLLAAFPDEVERALSLGLAELSERSFGAPSRDPSVLNRLVFLFSELDNDAYSRVSLD